MNVEEAIIGGVLQEPYAIRNVNLFPESFSVKHLADIWEAFIALDCANTQINIITVTDWLEKETGSAKYYDWLARIASEMHSAAGVQSYAKIIKDNHTRRQAFNIAAELQESLKAGGNDCVDVAISRLMNLGRAETKNEWDMVEALNLALDQIEKSFKDDGTGLGVKYGIPSLDNNAGSPRNSDLVIIAARPAMGKTALLLNMILGAGHDTAKGIISAEMPVAQIGIRMISLHGNIESHKLRTGDLNNNDWGKASNAVGSLRESKGYIYDAPAPNIVTVQRKLREWKYKKDIKVAYVDYLQRIHGSDRRAPRHEQVSEVVMTLKETARELDIPIVSLAQVNRECESRVDKRPQMSDIANSGEVEKEADQIMTIYRDGVYNDSSNEKDVAEIDYKKNRHGATGMIKLRWSAPFMRFTDLQEQY